MQPLKGDANVLIEARTGSPRTRPAGSKQRRDSGDRRVHQQRSETSARSRLGCPRRRRTQGWRSWPATVALLDRTRDRTAGLDAWLIKTDLARVPLRNGVGRDEAETSPPRLKEPHGPQEEVGDQVGAPSRSRRQAR